MAIRFSGCLKFVSLFNTHYQGCLELGFKKSAQFMADKVVHIRQSLPDLLDLTYVENVE